MKAIKNIKQCTVRNKKQMTNSLILLKVSIVEFKNKNIAANFF